MKSEETVLITIPVRIISDSQAVCKVLEMADCMQSNKRPWGGRIRGNKETRKYPTRPPRATCSEDQDLPVNSN
jgi:hypothetical protein